MAQPKLTFSLTYGEAVCLHNELGDVPKSKCGPKLLELYGRLDTALDLWSKQTPRPDRKTIRIDG